MGGSAFKFVVLLSTAGWGAVASAQETTSPEQQASGQQSGGIDDIVVTAQRRSESAQSVPISLQSFSENSLKDSRVTRTEDLENVVGGLVIQYAGARPSIFLRGVGNNSSNTTPSVLTFVDGVYNPFGQSTDLVNIERIEVLKGPQGTLFGRNATGGVLQIITKPPSETFSGRFELGYANYQTVDASGYVTGGLADGVAVDLSFSYQDQNEGYGRNLGRGEDLFLSNRLSLRSRLRAELSSRSTLTLSADYKRVFSNIGGTILPAFGEGLFVDGQYRTYGNSYFPNDFDGSQGPEKTGIWANEWGASLTFEHEFDTMLLRNISSYREGAEHLNVNADASPLRTMDLRIDRDPRKAITQELQLLSNNSSRLNWVVGIFYYRGTADINPFGFYGTQAEAVFGQPAGEIFGAYAHDVANSYAAYAQGTYEITPTTKLTLGGRYTSEKREVTGEVRQGTVVVPGRSGTLTAKTNEPTWRVAIDQKITPDILLYGSVSRSFNSGFYNQGNLAGYASEAANPKVEPEFLTAYEVGVKSDLFNRRLRINISAFKYKYNNLQQQIYLDGASRTINAGSSSIKGIDFEFIARPVSSLTLSLTGTYLDSHFKSYPLAPNFVRQPNGSIITVGNRDASGNETVQTPELSYTAGVSHDLRTSIGNFTTAGTLTYRSSMFVDAQNYYTIPHHYLLNLSERWTASNGKLFATLWVKNLTDERYDYGVQVQTPYGLVGTHASPRTYGATVGVEF